LPTMTGPFVRRIRKEDVSGIYEIEKNSFRHPYPPYLIDLLFETRRQAFFVAEIRDRVVGYAVAAMDAHGFGHVISVAVSYEMRRRGIGKALMRRLIQELKGIGVSILRLEVEKDNIAAQKMYEGLGFKLTGVIKDYYESGGDAYVMTLSLG